MQKQGVSHNALLEQVKNAGQDFEWYPTTREIMETVCRDLKVYAHDSVLDIGAGNGNVFTLIDEIMPEEVCSRYAIEKSEVLINNMPKDVYVIGTDFHQQTLIDKEVDAVFSNPPYSEYATWAIKIIRECNCKTLYLVIPQRWKDDPGIQLALKSREVKADVIGEFDFEDSEYRKARAKVNILRIEYHGRYSRVSVDPFDLWFDETFSFGAKRENHEDLDDTQEDEGNPKVASDELVEGDDLISRLVVLYQKDLERLYNNYRAIETLDPTIMHELGIEVKAIKEGLKGKIKGNKNKYWKELFDNLDTITSKLIAKNRQAMLDKLTAHTSIDFTAQNAYAVIIWAVKNANHYFDSQLLEMYMNMTEPKNVKGYKSNQRFLDDKWRYAKRWDSMREIRGGKVTHYTLDYRLVFEQSCANFSSNGWDTCDFPNKLRKSNHTFINDIFTVAKNLGFNVEQSTMQVGDWIPGELVKFTHNGGKAFAEIRAYKNGNIHCKFDQNFMKALNVEAGRLNGWLRSPEEAAAETGIKDAAKYFKTNLRVLPSDTMLMLGNGQAKETA